MATYDARKVRYCSDLQQIERTVCILHFSFMGYVLSYAFALAYWFTLLIELIQGIEIGQARFEI
jgi:hypothetical protein